MHDENGHSEVPQHFAGGDGRVLGHGGAQVYRALCALDAASVGRFNSLARESVPLQVAIAVAAERLATVEVALMVLLGLRGRRGMALRMLVAVAAIYCLCEVIGQAWPRPRPFERLPRVHAFNAHSGGRSFPSRHVASGVAMAVVGGREHPRLGWVMAGAASLLGTTRLAGALHYPSDVLGGAVLGWLVGAVLSPRGRRTRP
jgi:membrane-associated phospholipid phosphatase